LKTTAISLIGFAGTGKSTVAALLGGRLNARAVDVDTEIEKETGRSIPAIFAEDGEAAFRQIELAAIRRLLADNQDRATVFSLGGGATVTEAARRAVAAAGLIVCLDATPETIFARLKTGGDPSGRPLLDEAAGIDRIRRLKAQRAALYGLADFTVHTDGRSPESIAEEIARYVSGEGDRVFTRAGREAELSQTPAGIPPIVDAPGAAAIVRTTSAEYPAYVGWGELDRLGEHARRATGARRAFVLSDANVLSIWGETAVSSLKAAGIETATLALPPGDGTKSIESAAEVYDWLAAHRAERRDALVCLGGGMAGDLGGFVAATYMRGMPFVQVPTSLLAMVDASIGGKTAVNRDGAKNLIGAFYQPRAVIADVATLRTLPRREFVEGFGEVIKHALIRDPDLLDLLEARLDDVLALEPEITTEIIRRNIQIKAAVVSEDERETGGVREVLNYGHTLGHAFESAGAYEALLHGEAVSVGMMAAATIGEHIGLTPESLVQRQKRLLERAGLPLRPPAGLDRDRVLGALSLDKKVSAGKQRWVLLADVGRVAIRDDVPAELVVEVVDEMLARR
jgi:shikimate kinase / 3-dehydroquinate synthase